MDDLARYVRDHLDGWTEVHRRGRRALIKPSRVAHRGRRVPTGFYERQERLGLMAIQFETEAWNRD